MAGSRPAWNDGLAARGAPPREQQSSASATYAYGQPAAPRRVTRANSARLHGAGLLASRPSLASYSGGKGAFAGGRVRRSMSLSATMPHARPTGDDRRRRLDELSRLAERAEQLATALRTVEDESEALHKEVNEAEVDLRYRHEMSLALEQALETAARQLGAAEAATERRARLELLSNANAEAASAPPEEEGAPPATIAECAVLEQRAAGILVEAASAISELAPEQPSAMAVRRALRTLAALADGRAQQGGGSGAAAEESGAYEAILLSAPWIPVDTREWAVLLPADAVETGEEGSDEKRSEGSGSEDDDGAVSMHAVPIEALTQQHAFVHERLQALRGATGELQTEVKNLAASAQFASMDADRDGLISAADARPHAGAWGVPELVVQRAFSGAALPLAGGRERMSHADFVRFVEWVEDGGSTEDGLRAWVRCLDIDGDGRIGREDLQQWHAAVHGAAGNDAEAATVADADAGQQPAAATAAAGSSAEAESVQPFSRARAVAGRQADVRAHVDVGGADTPRAEPRSQARAAESTRAATAEQRTAGPSAATSSMPARKLGGTPARPEPSAARGAAADEGGPSGVVGVGTTNVGTGPFSVDDLICQLADMVGSHEGAAEAAGGGFSFSALKKCGLAPAFLQLLMTPMPAAGAGAAE